MFTFSELPHGLALRRQEQLPMRTGAMTSRYSHVHAAVFWNAISSNSLLKLWGLKEETQDPFQWRAPEVALWVTSSRDKTLHSNGGSKFPAKDSFSCPRWSESNSLLESQTTQKIHSVNSSLIYCQHLAEWLGRVILFCIKNKKTQLLVSFLFLWRRLLNTNN